MKLLAILCIGFAAYLWLPLPNGIMRERKSDKKHATPKSDPLKTESSPASTSDVLQALQVIQLGISSGMTIGDAVSYAQTHSPPPAAQDLERVLNTFRMGIPLAKGLDEMAMQNPNWRSTTDTLVTALNAGSQIGDHFADVEFVLQSAIDTEKLKRIKSVAVKSVLPLGLCFLPAFVLLAVIPIVASLLIGITK